MSSRCDEIQARRASRSTTSRMSVCECLAQKARAVSIVSPVTYGLGHDSPYPVTFNVRVVAQRLDVSERSADA